MAETFQKNCKKTSDLFIKEYFKVLPFCSSKYSDRNINAVSRITNSFLQALNAKYYLPEFMILFLDDDLIEFLNYKRFNLASLLGPWIEYISQCVSESIQDRYQKLSAKARPKNITQVYWVEAVSHTNFDYLNQQARDTFTKCLEATCKIYQNMRVLKL